MLHEALLGFSQMAIIVYDERANFGGVWALIRRIFSTGVPRVYRDLQGLFLRDLPRLLKVDLMIN